MDFHPTLTSYPLQHTCYYFILIIYILVGHARLRLRSMYAENPDDSFLFQWKGETLELLDTPFAGKLDPKLFAYLSSCNSVPSFLANVTLELFDNQTFLG